MNSSNAEPLEASQAVAVCVECNIIDDMRSCRQCYCCYCGSGAGELLQCRGCASRGEFLLTRFHQDCVKSRGVSPLRCCTCRGVLFSEAQPGDRHPPPIPCDADWEDGGLDWATFASSSCTTVLQALLSSDPRVPFELLHLGCLQFTGVRMLSQPFPSPLPSLRMQCSAGTWQLFSDDYHREDSFTCEGLIDDEMVELAKGLTSSGKGESESPQPAMREFLGPVLCAVFENAGRLRSYRVAPSAKNRRRSPQRRCHMPTSSIVVSPLLRRRREALQRDTASPHVGLAQ
jgi:hypothetical protein